VVESSRRLTAEPSYGYIHGLWWLWLADGRSVVSVPPGAGRAIRAIVGAVDRETALFDEHRAEALKGPVEAALRDAGRPATDRVLHDVVFAGNGALLKRHPRSDCCRLREASIPPVEGLRLPTHCFPDGVVFGVVQENQVVSVAFAHRTGILEDCVADLGVETAPGYRRRGYAQAAVSALVGHFTQGGGEARYGCSPSNLASMATARSVGLVPYGQSLILSAPWAA
jgi:hypothetical protein